MEAILELAYRSDDFRAMSMTVIILGHDTDVTSVHVHTSVHVIYNVKGMDMRLIILGPLFQGCYLLCVPNI